MALKTVMGLEQAEWSGIWPEDIHMEGETASAYALVQLAICWWLDGIALGILWIKRTVNTSVRRSVTNLEALPYHQRRLC